MLVNTAHFCSLSSNPQFLSWLRQFAKDIHDDLVEHKRRSNSCQANTTKMVLVLEQIVKRDGGETALVDFLRQTFPHILTVTPTPTQPASQPGRQHVFDHYDPTLLTLPRRIILDSDDAARRFLADKPIGEYVVVDGKAYVEYLPTELAHLESKIPRENWQVRTWRAGRR